VEDQKNTAQLVRIGAIVDVRWGLKEVSQNSKKDKDKNKDSSDVNRKGPIERPIEGLEEVEEKVLG